MATVRFLIFTQKIEILNENSRHLMENNISNTQIIWVFIEKYLAWTLEGY